MRSKTVLGAVPIALTVFLAPFVSRQEPPWCFRFHGDSTSRCNYYTLQECLIGTKVVGGTCERYEARPGQLTPGQQQKESAAAANKGGRKPR